MDDAIDRLPPRLRALYRLLRERVGYPGNEISLREIDRRLGRGRNYTSRLLSGKQKRLTFEHVFVILDAADLDASAFFRDLGERLAESGKVAVPAPKDGKVLGVEQERIERLMETAVRVVLAAELPAAVEAELAKRLPAYDVPRRQGNGA